MQMPSTDTAIPVTREGKSMPGRVFELGQIRSLLWLGRCGCNPTYCKANHPEKGKERVLTIYARGPPALSASDMQGISGMQDI